MGIGRRKFLQLFQAGLVALAANPSNAIAILDDQYVNRKLGIAFRKPHDWTFADVRDMGQVKAGQILDLDDLQLSQEVMDSIELPILTISQAPLASDSRRFSPGVTIYLDRFTFIDRMSDDVEIEIPPLDNVVNDVESLAAMLKNFQVTTSPKSMQVSRCEAADYSATFLFEHENMRPTPVRMRTVTIFQRPALYTIRMFDSPQSGSKLMFDFTPFIESIRMV